MLQRYLDCHERRTRGPRRAAARGRPLDDADLRLVPGARGDRDPDLGVLQPRLRHLRAVPTGANRQPAVAWYCAARETPRTGR